MTFSTTPFESKTKYSNHKQLHRSISTQNNFLKVKVNAKLTNFNAESHSVKKKFHVRRISDGYSSKCTCFQARNINR